MEDVKISGKGTITGGEYQSVTVSGMGKCTGTMRADTVVVNGTFKVEGGAEYRALSINGTFKCEGALAAEEVICNGAATIEGNMVANALSVSGMLHAEGGRLQSEKLSCTGILTMDGLVSCDELHVTGIIKAEQIEGEHVRIRSQKPAALMRFIPSKGLSRVDFVQGRELDLSGVTAETVSGTDVTIGPDCYIECVKCNGTLSIHPSSTVEEIKGDYTRR